MRSIFIAPQQQPRLGSARPPHFHLLQHKSGKYYAFAGVKLCLPGIVFLGEADDDDDEAAAVAAVSQNFFVTYAIFSTLAGIIQ